MIGTLIPIESATLPMSNEIQRFNNCNIVAEGRLNEKKFHR